MTGYGKGSATLGDASCTVEIRSVNARQLEARFRLPSALYGLEAPLRERVQRAIARGRVEIVVSWSGGTGSHPPHAYNPRAARAMYDAWNRMREELGLPDEPRAEVLLRLPGVLEPVEGAAADLEQAGVLVTEALEQALEAHGEARRVEGGRMARDLEQRSTRLTSWAAEIKQLAEGAPERLAQQVRARAEELLAETPVDEERLVQEIAFLASRADVTEEIVRLDAHLDRLLASFEPDAVEIGRQLEFLVQEIRREVTTIASKVSDPEVDRRVLDIKGELEKIREQAANLE
jgi:uncharacterized protein (TIGR00255 family)